MDSWKSPFARSSVWIVPSVSFRLELIPKAVSAEAALSNDETMSLVALFTRNDRVNGLPLGMIHLLPLWWKPADWSSEVAFASSTGYGLRVACSLGVR